MPSKPAMSPQAILTVLVTARTGKARRALTKSDQAMKATDPGGTIRGPKNKGASHQ